MKTPSLYKTVVVIWSEEHPEEAQMELSDLAEEAETGSSAYCSKQVTTRVEDPTADPDWDGTEFFDEEEAEEE
jgi:hypothetical protein